MLSLYFYKILNLLTDRRKLGEQRDSFSADHIKMYVRKMIWGNQVSLKNYH